MQRVPNTRATAAYLLAAIIAYGLFYALGMAVAHRPPGSLDLGAHVLSGHGTLIAWLLTQSMFLSVLAPLCLVLIAVAVFHAPWRARIIVSVLLLVAMWAAADALQHFFARPRRLDWLVKHETAFSFPSSHAALATAFYGYWSFVFARCELPKAARTIASEALTALVIAILWSRLALGAHYPSDLLGGVLLGVCGIALALAVCSALRIALYPGFLGDYRARP